METTLNIQKNKFSTQMATICVCLAWRYCGLIVWCNLLQMFSIFDLEYILMEKVI